MRCLAAVRISPITNRGIGYIRTYLEDLGVDAIRSDELVESTLEVDKGFSGRLAVVLLGRLGGAIEDVLYPVEARLEQGDGCEGRLVERAVHGGGLGGGAMGKSGEQADASRGQQDNLFSFSCSLRPSAL